MLAREGAAQSHGVTTLDPATAKLFADSLHGRLITPESADYDEQRTVWNAMIDRRPALIARCADTDDVVRSVNFAREHSLLLTVRSGGYNIAGLAVSDGGLMIDLSAMDAVDVDPVSRRLTVGPGATAGLIDRHTQQHGLAVPVGISPGIGIGGLTLGGGFGWLSRRHGLTIDNLLSAEVVTASGETVVANDAVNPDLYWGLRGGGGHFGVVTSLEFQLHEIGPEVLAGLIVHPFDDAPDVLRHYRAVADRAPDDLTAWLVLRDAPTYEFLPDRVHGERVVIVAMLYAGPAGEDDDAVRALREFGNPLADDVRERPFVEFQRAFDPLLSPGYRNYWKSHYLPWLSDGLIDVTIDQVGGLPTPQSEVFIAQVGGAAGRVPADATAYSNRDAEFVMNVHARWESPTDDKRCIQWARAIRSATLSQAIGGEYLNFSVADESDPNVPAYGFANSRLIALKEKYDPLDLFRCNHSLRANSGQGAARCTAQ